LIIELAVPVFLIIFGLGLTLYEVNKNSPIRELTIEDFPEKQRIVYNENKLVSSDVSSIDIINLLDDLDYYDPEPYSVKETANT